MFDCDRVGDRKLAIVKRLKTTPDCCAGQKRHASLSSARSASRARVRVVTSPCRLRRRAKIRSLRSSIHRSRGARARSSDRTAVVRAQCVSARPVASARARGLETAVTRFGQLAVIADVVVKRDLLRPVPPSPPSLPVAGLVDDDAVDPGAEGGRGRGTCEWFGRRAGTLPATDRAPRYGHRAGSAKAGRPSVGVRSQAPSRRPRRGRHTAGSARLHALRLPPR